MNYRVYRIHNGLERRVGEAKTEEIALAVFMSVANSVTETVELRYLDPASTKWEVLGRKLMYSVAPCRILKRNN